MKKKIMVLFLCFTAMALFPLIAVKSTPQSSRLQEQSSLNENKNSENSNEKNIVSKQEEEQNNSKDGQTASFRILDEDTGQTITVDDKNFCYGAVAAEMLPSFDKEALKAQCIATYTHFCRLREEQRKNPDSDLKGADFSAKLSENQYYMSDKAMRNTWGEFYNKSFENIKQAVDEVFGEVLTDSDGKLIIVAYHAVSGGTTETYADVFGKEVSYLQAVPSPGDTVAPGYLSECTVSEKDFKAKILVSDNKVKLSGSADKWIGKFQKTSSGSVKSVKIGNVNFQGTEIRKIFGLRSANFDVAYSDGNFIFTVRGYGHGVGMSQYGAEYMAQQGADCKEILSWYYKGTKTEKYTPKL